MNAIVNFALRQRVMMLLFLFGLIAAGVVAFSRLNIEAYPDPVPPMVNVVTQSPGQSAAEIERYITIPTEVGLAGLKNVKSVRSTSIFGLSNIEIQFTYDYTYDQAEQKVLNQLGQIKLPDGVSPQISPWSPIGEIMRYQIKGPPGYSVTDKKTLQDWVLSRRFKAVPGVIDVTGWAGKTKSYDVSVDQDKLVRLGIPLSQVLQAIGDNNGNVGAQTIDIGPQSAVVRGVGLVGSMDDIRNILVTSKDGVPVMIKDVATVEVGNTPRLGIVGRDNDDDIVQGVVLMRRGEESLPTIRKVEAELNRINESGILPPGVSLERVYDRSELIAVTTHTVLHNLIFGVVLIFCVQWFFLGDLRSAVIVSATIPFALFFAILIMVLRGESANLLSVGAIDFGLIVDATVIMVENIFRHLSQKRELRFAETGLLHETPSTGLWGKLAVISNSAKEVSRAIFFSAAVIIAGFLPLFTLNGVEGHIFGPMAQTYAYAILGGLIATFTVSPALSALMLSEQVEEKETLLLRLMRKAYTPIIRFTLANKFLTLGCAAALAVFAFVAAKSLGMEFLPKLEEGNMWIRATLPTSVSLEEARSYTNRMRHILMKFPEAETVISQLGRPDDGTDASGFYNAEFNVPLKPPGEWPKGLTKEKLTHEMQQALAEPFPGVEFNFSQYIEDNVAEAASGIKGENSVKLYGNDLAALRATALQVEAVMSKVKGVEDLSIFDPFGQPTVDIKVDRERAARYGLSVGAINATIESAIGGKAAGNLYESGSDRNFPIVVRLQGSDRSDLDSIRRIPIVAQNSSGQGMMSITLQDVADVKLTSGFSTIYREGQERFIPIKFSVRGRDLGSAVLEAQEKIREQVKLPAGARLDWLGEFGELQNAMARLRLVVPLSLLLIGVLLYLNFSSVVDALLAASVMPMALIGGVLALYFTGTPFSVSAAIGFIGLFGIAVMEGIIVIAYFNQLMAEGKERTAAILHAAQTRLRPVMMTCIAACVGLLPAALANAIGSQVQKPLALVVVGGVLLAPALVLIVLPVFIELFSRRKTLVTAVAAPAAE